MGRIAQYLDLGAGLESRLAVTDQQVAGLDIGERSRLPLKRVGVADDVAAAVTACATGLRYATGSVFVVDGGRALG